MIHLETVVTIGKSLNIKREKGEDETEQTFAHLKFAELFVTREQATDLCGQRPGWTETSFFDELGAPLGDWTLKLNAVEFTLAGAVDAPDGEGIRLTGATVTGIELTFTSLGAVMSGQIVWPIRGDEAGDIEPLLGRECRAEWHLTDGGQGDMLKERAA